MSLLSGWHAAPACSSGLHTRPSDFLIWDDGPMSSRTVIAIARACYSTHGMHQRFGGGGPRPHACAVAGVLDSAVATDVAPPLLENDAADAAASLEEGPRGPPAAEQTPSSDPDLDPEVSCGSVADDVAEGAPEAAQPAADAEAAGGGGSSTGAAAAGPPQDAADDVRPEGEGSGGEGGGGGTERLGRPGAQDGEVAAGALEGTAIDPFLQVLTAGESMLPPDRRLFQLHSLPRLCAELEAGQSTDVVSIANLKRL